MENNVNLLLVLSSGLIGLLFAFMKTSWINRQEEGNERMQKIGKNIADGAMAFISAEYKVLSVFVGIVAALLAFAAKNQNSIAKPKPTMATAQYCCCLLFIAII